MQEKPEIGIGENGNHPGRAGSQYIHRQRKKDAGQNGEFQGQKDGRQERDHHDDRVRLGAAQNADDFTSVDHAVGDHN